MKKALWFFFGFITLIIIVGLSNSEETTIPQENVSTQQQIVQETPISESVESTQTSYKSTPTQQTTSQSYTPKTETTTPVVEPDPIPESIPTPVVEKPTYTPPTYEPAQTSCCKICSKGKACGDSCISRSYTCHKGPGCACNG